MGLLNKHSSAGGHASCVSPNLIGQAKKPVLADYLSHAFSVYTTSKDSTASVSTTKCKKKTTGARLNQSAFPNPPSPAPAASDSSLNPSAPEFSPSLAQRSLAELLSATTASAQRYIPPPLRNFRTFDA